MIVQESRSPSSEVNQDSRRHLPRVDVLRGWAILCVFIFHFLGATYGFDWWRWDGQWRSFQVPFRPLSYLLYPLTLGWTGVSLFFVISGFVIHLSYLNSKSFRLGSFYWRRFWRIYPAYLLALIGFSLFFHLPIQTDVGQVQFLFHLLLVHNLHPQTFFGINGSFWSLAIEFQFYLLYPVILLLRHKFDMKKTLLATFALSVVSRLVLLCFADCSYPITPLWTFPSLLWFDWTLGAYIAERFRNGERAFGASPHQIVGAALLFVLSTLFKPTNAFSFSSASFVCALLLDYIVHQNSKPSALERLLIPLGLCSYSVYLWHQPVLDSFADFARTSPWMQNIWLYGASIVGLSVAVLGWSWISYCLVEKHSMKIGKMLSKRL